MHPLFENFSWTQPPLIATPLFPYIQLRKPIEIGGRGSRRSFGGRGRRRGNIANLVGQGLETPGNIQGPNNNEPPRENSENDVASF
jgi:hypothetical protein